MAAVGTTASMPSRPYSPRIVGSVWPRTSPEAWSETANGLQEKSAELSTSAGGIRRSADDLGSSNSGQMIEAMLAEKGLRVVGFLVMEHPRAWLLEAVCSGLAKPCRVH